MILKNRLFIRQLPDRSAQNIYIFCEGIKTEYQYFQYFQEIDSRINIEIYRLTAEEDNSPKGLMSIAKKCLEKSESNPNPKYELIEGDEVWLVFDTDKDKFNSRNIQISKIREECNKLKWGIAQSNPCFEVWLYFHFFDKKAEFEDNNISKNWKQFLNEKITGGFDSRRHPIKIQAAAVNAENAFIEKGKIPDVGSTEVYKLAKSIILVTQLKLDNALKNVVHKRNS